MTAKDVVTAQAQIHPGTLLHAWDHGGLQLRDPAGEVCFYVSLYLYTFDRTDGRGHVAILRSTGAGGSQPFDVTMTDNEALAIRHLERRNKARGLGGGSVTIAAFERRETTDSLEFTVTGSDLAIELGWNGLEPPFFVMGHHPQDASIETFGQMREAVTTTTAVNGVTVPGSTFANEAYTPWLGRPLHSAAVTIGEVLIKST